VICLSGPKVVFEHLSCPRRRTADRRRVINGCDGGRSALSGCEEALGYELLVGGDDGRPGQAEFLSQLATRWETSFGGETAIANSGPQGQGDRLFATQMFVEFKE
jgi:hypothetical protein